MTERAGTLAAGRRESGVLPTGLAPRLGLVLLLLVIGLGLAVIGNAFGVVDGVGGEDDSTSLAVGNETVTLVSNGETITVGNLTAVTEIEISDVGGEVVVDLDRSGPLSEADRQTAVAVARGNETIRGALGDPDDYGFDVEPIETATATESVTTVDVDVTEHAETESEEPADIDVVEVNATEDDSITIERETEYLDDEAVVRITALDTGDRVFTAVIDLESERVVSVRDERPE